MLHVAQSALGSVLLTENGLYLFHGDTPVAGQTSGSWIALPVSPALPRGLLSARVLTSADAQIAGIAHSTGVIRLSCSATSCSAKALSAEIGVVHAAACSAAAGCAKAWIAAENGLFVQAGGTIQQVTTKRQFAVAVSPDDASVFSGNDQHMYHWDAASVSLIRQDWVTIVATGAGGVYADTIRDMVFAPDGTLFVATRSALNVRWVNGTVSRVDGLGGLPMTNLTSIALGVVLTVDEHTAGLVGNNDVSFQLVIGSDQGLATVQVGGVPQFSQSPPPNMTPTTLWTNWRYFNGPRYLPTRSAVVNATGNAVLSVAGGASQSSNVGFQSILVATTGGVGMLYPATWTLQQKAAEMELIQARHNRYGMSGDCTLGSFGNFSDCINGGRVSDNNGLWTSLVVVAESMRFAVTQEPAALTAATTFLQGMHLLVKVTGVHGLMGRSAVAPGGTHGPGGTYHNSSVPSLRGWQWKGDASSDEVTGHTFAYPIAAALLGDAVLPPGPWNRSMNAAVGASARDTALELLRGIVSYVVANNFTLVDVTGEATQWGHWDPKTLNLKRSWSDGRGVNSLQILAYLQAALATTPDDAPFKAQYLKAFQLLTGAQHGHDYNGNLVNLKIKTPVDDNYSDDELTFLPYYLFAACNAAATGNAAVPTELLRVSLRRTFDFVRQWRSNLWGTIWLATRGGSWVSGEQSPLAAACTAVGSANSASDTAGAGSTSSAADSTSSSAGRRRQRGLGRGPVQSTAVPDWSAVPYSTAVAEDIAWNLRTWPVEGVSWPVQNSNRQDIFFRPGQNRAFRTHEDSVRVLPANERAQPRWNGNPHQLDGGNGLSETGSGAWLLPYWMARYHSILGAPASAQ